MHGGSRSAREILMDSVTKRRQLIQKWIGLSPVPDRLRHIRDVLEIREQPDYSRKIVGMIPASQEAVSGGIQIRRRLLQRVSRGPIGQRNSDCHLKPAEELFVAGLGIERDKVDCVLLALRPHPLSANIGAHRGKRLQTKAGE